LATVLLAIDVGRHDEEVITALARRLHIAQIGYLCAWGPGCVGLEALFDIEFADAQGAGVVRPFLMTTSHDDESLAEALWFAIDCAVSPEAKGVPPVVVGADSPAWRAQMRHWLEDIEALRGAVCGPEQ
jgi:hypothetical protein